MQHLDEGTIHAWLDGALEPNEATRVEEHARSCATCAAAVAEARGLVAGASRVLGALDQMPGGVIPSGGSLGTARVPHRSLWRVLHFTPGRAAAAALLIVAAGTVVVVRHAPNPNAPPLPVAAAPTEARQADRPMPKASPPVSKPATASPKFGVRREASDRAAPRTPTSATSANVAIKAAQPAKFAAPVPSLERSVVGGVAGKADVASVQLTGCYDVEADSVLGLPRRITLDSTHANWAPIAGNGVRLMLPGNAAAPIDLHIVSPAVLEGTTTVASRAITVTLRRATDCPVR